MRFADPRYCNGFRYEERYDPTDEETEGYDSHKWISEIGDVLFDTIFGVFNTAIDKVTGGIITDWLGEGTTLESLLAQVVDNGSNKLNEAIAETGSKLNTLIAKTVNTSAEAMAEFVGVADAQKKIADGINNTIDRLIEESQTDAQRLYFEKQEAARLEALRVAESIRWAQAVEEGVFTTFSDATYDALKQSNISIGERADLLIGFTFNEMERNKEIMTDLAVLHGQRVAASFGQVADAQLSMANEVLLEAVVKPLAQGEAYFTALKQAGKATNDEYEQSMIQQAILQAQLAADIMNSDLNPLDYLRSRLKAD